MATQPERLKMGRTLKIGSFHVGSAFSDILLSAVWNRILISNLGLPAGPVAILAALRYLLAPLSIWAGDRSDRHPIFGKYRLPYIWGGRAMMALGLLLIPPSTLFLAEDPSSVMGWGLATLCFVVCGAGTLISGSPFLALLRDSAPPSKRGQALSIAQIMLLFAFSMAPALYGALIKNYDQASLWRAVLIGVGLAIPFWFFSLWGEDHHDPQANPQEEQIPLRTIMGMIWGDPRARTFFVFLSLAMISVFAQDALLEPFGGDVFGLDVGATTRWNAFWGLAVLVSMVGGTIITRKRAPHEQVGTTLIGLGATMVAMVLLGVVAILKIQAAMIPTIIIFGLGFGIQTVGTISLLMAMTSDRHAGAYLGFWSLAQLVFRGVGMGLGGVIRDMVLAATNSHTIAYGSVFLLEAVGLAGCIMLLMRIDVVGFARGAMPSTHDRIAALAD
ncbi:PUCC protein [Oscillochloris trichoides DG-6]|uniref:PUCC protein n=1 Tax=Oscillochloris trichoides DG-6 TaxID=765420 RepID=E1IEA9_9CHLR|nr:BCD family MFS transporter [Oscillochloris trichoides]EFO80435.1 PUCC protein [Oscillochloris trichoides DG-6]